MREDIISLSEVNFEKYLINLLQKFHNFEYKTATEILSLRGSYSNVILDDIFRNAIKTINRSITEQMIEDAINQIRRVSDSSLESGNKYFHELLINGIKVENEQSELVETVQIVDFHNWEKNQFIVTNQFQVQSENYNDSAFHILDLVVYLNGLPIVVFELKSPSKSGDTVIHDAIQQIKNYQSYCPSLFVYNFFNVVSDSHTNKYGTITSNSDRYCFWRAPTSNSGLTYLQNPANKKPPTKGHELQEFLWYLFNPQIFLKLLKHYTFFTENKHLEKVIAAYHQYYGVEATKASVIIKIQKQDKGVKKGGIFWHTQGSGKTFSMTMLIKNVIQVHPKLTTIVVTDRNNLDEQIKGVFQKVKNYLGQKITAIESRAQLFSQTFKVQKQNGIFLSTLQKFLNKNESEDVDTQHKRSVISERHDILIIIDEAHRSHRSADYAEWKLGDGKVDDKFSYAHNLRIAFPNAVFVGFTATPIVSEEHKTKDVFGKYVTKYLMNQAQEDGFIVGINYDYRHEKLKLDTSKLQKLDNTIEEIKNKIIKNNKEISRELIRNFNKKIQQMKWLLSDDDRIYHISKDFIEHYKQREHILKGKSLFVALDRQIAFKYYKKILELEPTWENKVKLIMTHNPRIDSDKQRDLLGDSNYRKNMAQKFKKDEKDFKIAIVVSMWLTGFDVPFLDTIYIDRPLKMHNLMQTICRVNRVYTDKENPQKSKKSGLVVDYFGLTEKLKEAIKFYVGKTSPDAVDSLNVKDWLNVDKMKRDLLQLTKEIYQTYLKDLVKFDFSTISADNCINIINDIREAVLSNETDKEFLLVTKNLKKYFVACVSNLSNQEKKRIQILMLARSQMVKDKLGVLDLEKEVQKIKKMVQDVIKHSDFILPQSSENIVFDLRDLINYVLTNDAQWPFLKLENCKLAIKDILKKLRKINLIRSEKYSQKLQQLINKYNAKLITYNEFMSILKEIAQDVQKLTTNYKKDGFLSPSEVAFYEIIASHKFCPSGYDKKMLRKITREVYQKIKIKIPSRFVFATNEKIKGIIRGEIQLILFEYGYPPEDGIFLGKILVKQLERQIELNSFDIFKKN